MGRAVERARRAVRCRLHVEQVVEGDALGPVGELPFGPSATKDHRPVDIGAEQEVEHVGGVVPRDAFA